MPTCMCGLSACVEPCLSACVAYLHVLSPPSLRQINTSEVYHSGLKLDDPLTKERTHDYLLFTSPRKVLCCTHGAPHLTLCHSRNRSPSRSHGPSLNRSPSPSCSHSLSLGRTRSLTLVIV